MCWLTILKFVFEAFVSLKKVIDDISYTNLSGNQGFPISIYCFAGDNCICHIRINIRNFNKNWKEAKLLVFSDGRETCLFSGFLT